MTDPTERLVAQAMLDVSIERLVHLHPGAQLFVFGPHGEPMWTPWPPTDHDLEIFRASGLYTAMVLDAERTLMAVVIHKPRPKKPAEDRGVPEVSQRNTRSDSV